MSDWIRIAFVSKNYPSPSPVVALNYFGDLWEGFVCDAIPNMPVGEPASSLAAFVSECLNEARDSRCVELWNLELKSQPETGIQNWAANHPIWREVDALVDVDRWIIRLPSGEQPIPGSESQPRFDPERFDRWPRRMARFISFLQRR